MNKEIDTREGAAGKVRKWKDGSLRIGRRKVYAVARVNGKDVYMWGSTGHMVVELI